MPSPYRKKQLHHRETVVRPGKAGLLVQLKYRNPLYMIS